MLPKEDRNLRQNLFTNFKGVASSMYWEIIKKSWWHYLIELVIAIVFINWDLKIFLIYAFLLIIFKIDAATNYLRKLIRVTQVANEVKLSAIVRKLKITDQELDDNMKEVKKYTGEKEWSSLEKDLKDIRPI